MRHRDSTPNERDTETESVALDRVFGALADPVRRAILRRLDGAELLVSDLAEPFDISLQAVSRHIQVLVRAGLVTKERTGRISRCRLDAVAFLKAAVWISKYSRYWQEQFDSLTGRFAEPDRAKQSLGDLPARPARRAITKRRSG